MIDERLRRLRRDHEALRTEREAAVVSLQFGTSEALWVPEVPLSPRSVDASPAFVAAPDGLDLLAGLDADGRPAIVRAAFGVNGEAPAAVVAHSGEESDNWVLHSRVLTWSGARLEVVGFLTHREISHVTWIDHDENGRPVRFSTAGVPHNTQEWGVTEISCEWDGDRCVRAGEHTAQYDDAGLLRIRRDDRVVWERAVDGDEPDPLAADEALEIWLDAVAGAARRALGERDAAAVKVSPRFRHDSRPIATFVERDYVADAAARIGAREAIDRCWEPQVDLLPLIGEEGLRAWRSLRAHDADDGRRSVAEGLQHRLAALDWPGDVLPLVWAAGAEPWRLAESVLGSARLEAIPATAAPEPPRVERPPADEQALAALLSAFDLPPVLLPQARWGLALVEGGSGRSKLGGRPPLDRDWPVHEDHPLTHLASIALGELPPFPGREDLPADGTLVFLAALTEEAELWEPTRCDDPRVALWHVPDGAAVADPPPYDTEIDEYEIAVVLPERRVAFAPVLTLPEQPQGLTAAERLSYEQLQEGLYEVTPGLSEPPHLLLGHPLVTQPYAIDPGAYILFHIGWDEELGFEFLDGGDLTLHGAREDVLAGRWEALTVSPNSG